MSSIAGEMNPLMFSQRLVGVLADKVFRGAPSRHHSGFKPQRLNAFSKLPQPAEAPGRHLLNIRHGFQLLGVGLRVDPLRPLRFRGRISIGGALAPLRGHGFQLVAFGKMPPIANRDTSHPTCHRAETQIRHAEHGRFQIRHLDIGGAGIRHFRPWRARIRHFMDWTARIRHLDTPMKGRSVTSPVPTYRSVTPTIQNCKSCTLRKPGSVTQGQVFRKAPR